MDHYPNQLSGGQQQRVAIARAIVGNPLVLLADEPTGNLDSKMGAEVMDILLKLNAEGTTVVMVTHDEIDARRVGRIVRVFDGQLAEPDAGDFATAIVAVKRRNASLGEFIDRFTKFVRMPPPEPRPTDIKAVVDDILWLNREQCNSRGIALGWQRCDTVAPLALDAQLIEQALLNIVKNAIEAIDEGARVRLSVIDSGDLLATGPARPLFTPFFTTRKGGQGIGLMFVREVLQRHGCTYSLAPGAPGETRFDIRFPVA
jgi:nitrogen fixation/metabolism regulation signal transduction histidine kinase